MAKVERWLVITGPGQGQERTVALPEHPEPGHVTVYYGDADGRRVSVGRVLLPRMDRARVKA